MYEETRGVGRTCKVAPVYGDVECMTRRCLRSLGKEDFFFFLNGVGRAGLSFGKKKLDLTSVYTQACNPND